jgi:nucleotide-binding universal stress UspA family protein
LTAAPQAAEKWVNSVVSLGNRERLKVRGEVLVHAVSVVQAISGYAVEKKVDLIVIGTRGLSSFKRLAIGSASTGVLNRAPCSVLVVR